MRYGLTTARFHAPAGGLSNDLERDLAVYLLDRSDNPGSTASDGGLVVQSCPGWDYVARSPLRRDPCAPDRSGPWSSASWSPAQPPTEAGWGPTVAAVSTSAPRDAGPARARAVGPGRRPTGATVVTLADGLLPELAEADPVVTAGGVTRSSRRRWAGPPWPYPRRQPAASGQRREGRPMPRSAWPTEPLLTRWWTRSWPWPLISHGVSPSASPPPP